MIVVKLGGSLYQKPELLLWMQALTHYSKHTPIVIIPGGGPFSDQVRNAQHHHKLTDKTAHHMAIIAMKQFGLLLADIAPNSQLIRTNEITAPLSIWLPDDSLLAEKSLPHNWTISSDSIALWLSTKIKAESLVLVKSIETHTSSIALLTDAHILDSGFTTLFSSNPIDTKIMPSHGYADFNSFLQQSSLHLP